MKKYLCTHRLRDKNNNIIKYRLYCTDKTTVVYDPDELKRKLDLTNPIIDVLNLTLGMDNKLRERKSQYLPGGITDIVQEEEEKKASQPTPSPQSAQPTPVKPKGIGNFNKQTDIEFDRIENVVERTKYLVQLGRKQENLSAVKKVRNVVLNLKKNPMLNDNKIEQQIIKAFESELLACIAVNDDSFNNYTKLIKEYKA